MAFFGHWSIPTVTIFHHEYIWERLDQLTNVLRAQAILEVAATYEVMSFVLSFKSIPEYELDRISNSEEIYSS